MEIHNSLQEKLGLDQVGMVWAFADDSNMCGPTSVIKEMCAVAVGILQKYELEVVVRKCKIVGDKVGNQASNTFTVIEGGTVVMGNPVGSLGYRRHTCDQMIRDMIKPLPFFKKLHPHSAYTLLHHCINAKPGYLARVVEPDAMGGAMKIFDLAVDRVVGELARSPVTPELKDLRELPQSLGGLGLTRHSGVGGQKAVMNSRRLAKAFAEKHARMLLPGTQKWGVVPLEDRMRNMFPVVPAANNVVDANNGDTGIVDVLVVTQNLIKQAAIHNYREMHSTLLDKLGEQGRASDRAWLRSGSTPSAARWLTWRGGLGRRVSFTEQQFVDAFRLRLLRPPIEGLQLGQHTCHCNNVSVADIPNHLLICPYNEGLTISRHNSICAYLVVLIKQCWPDAQVSREVPLNLEDGNDNHIVADIMYVRGEVVKYMDVTVAHPGAQRYLTRGSAEEVDVANIMRETAKTAIYNAVPGMAASGCFIPFAVEATGRLGPKAIEWVTALTAGKDVIFRSYCLNSISSGIARYNSRMIAHARAKMMAN